MSERVITKENLEIIINNLLMTNYALWDLLGFLQYRIIEESNNDFINCEIEKNNTILKAVITHEIDVLEDLKKVNSQREEKQRKEAQDE